MKHKLLLTCILVASCLLTFAILSPEPVLGTAMLIATLVLFLPYLVWRHERYYAIKNMEENFPRFLRDVVESLRAGMPLHKAIQAASRTRYGKLSSEVQLMARQISWGMPLNEVLELFAKRIESKRIRNAISIIREAQAVGGDVSATINSVASNYIQLGELAKERSSLLSPYVFVMYFLSIVFVAIVLAINLYLIPVFEIPAVEELRLGFTNPCVECIEEGVKGPHCAVCKFYELIAVELLRAEPVSQKEGYKSCAGAGKGSVCHISAYYASLFFLMALIHSISSGLIAGQIGEGALSAGIKHSLVLLGITLSAFLTLAEFGVLLPRA